MIPFEKHLFICINERTEGRECCAAKGSVEVHLAFKTKLRELGLSTRVRANKAGCLDQCKNGTTVVIYPQGIWYGHVTPADVNEIIEKSIIGDEIISRLLISQGKNQNGI